MSTLRVEDGNLVIGKWLAGIISALLVLVIVWLSGALMNARDQLPLMGQRLDALASGLTGTSVALNQRIDSEFSARDRQVQANIARRDAQIVDMRTDLKAVDTAQDALQRELAGRLARIEESLRAQAQSVEEIKRRLDGVSRRP